MADYIRLDRFDEAKAVAEKHFAQGFDNPQVHQRLLQIAWIERDRAAASRQIKWFTGTPEEHVSLEYQAAYLRMVGQLRQSHALLERAADLAQKGICRM